MAEQMRGQDALNRRLKAIGDTKAVLHRLQLDVVAEAKRLAPRKTGNLGRLIQVGALTPTYAMVFSHAKYSGWVEHGTGIYGPRHAPIVPVRASVLRFPAPGSATLGGRVRSGGSYVFARSVKGRPKTPFMIPGAQAAAQKNGMKDVIITEWNGAA